MSPVVEAGTGAYIEEPARSTPVYGSCDVLVVGGGPAGTAAAVAAGRLGADVVLVERYNHLGGLSTGGLVSWIDRMTDWDGRLVVAGVGAELIDRCGPDATLGPDPSLWGSTDPVQAAYWRVRTAALRDTVHWSPTVDPEVLKLVTNDIVRESNVHTLMHAGWSPRSPTANRVEGVIFESKQGRFALTAPVVDRLHRRRRRVRPSGRPVRRRLRQRERPRPADHELPLRQRRHAALPRLPHAAAGRVRRGHAARRRPGHQAARAPTPYDSVALFLTPKMAGYSALDVADLTAVEFVSRDMARDGLRVLPRARARLRTGVDPRHGLADRHPPRPTAGRQRADHDRALDGDGSYPDSIGLCPGMTPSFPTLEIPYRSLVPERLDGLLAAGRNLSADTRSHAALREIPECWAMGEAAGVAAVQALADGVALRDVDIPRSRPNSPAKARSSSARGGAARPGGASLDDEFAESIHRQWLARSPGRWPLRRGSQSGKLCACKRSRQRLQHWGRGKGAR